VTLSNWGSVNATLEAPAVAGSSDWGAVNAVLGQTSSAAAAVRGVMVAGSLVAAAVRGVISGGVLVPATVRLVTGAVAPPPTPDSPVLVGIYNGTSDGADDLFYNEMGSTIKLATSYYTVAAKVAGAWVLRSWDLTRISRGISPTIHVQSVSLNTSLGQQVQWFPWDGVAAGDYDTEWTQWANALVDAPPGTSFSFDGEPEVRLEAGSHQPVPNPNSPVGWPAGWPQNDGGHNTPSTYAAAVRRIYDVMHPIAPNIDYRFWMAGHERSTYMEGFYPGDAYVDSIAIDPYVWLHNSSSTTPKQKYEPIVNWLRGRSWGQGKPIGIGETGIHTGHGDTAGAAFWSGMPTAVRDLDLSFVTFYNRSSWTITPSTFPLSWSSYVDAMTEIASIQ
jgi:beta-mannanase